MENFAIYLGKSALWITGFTLVYFLFLRNERFFILKRIYLIAGMIASFIFPLISFHYPVDVPAITEVVPEISPSPAPDDLTSESIQGVTESLVRLNFGLISFLIYLSGILFLASRIVRQARMLYKKINGAKINEIGYARLVRTHEITSPFTFFNYVFISQSVTDAEMEPIMKHDLVHVRQKHWLDLLLAEIVCLLQWLNPFTWIYAGYIRINHEYIADREALQSLANPAVYKAVLINQMFSSPVISISNSFNYAVNKSRFEMMKNIITSPWRKLKLLFVLPVVTIVFFAFSTPEYQYATDYNSTDESIVSVIDSQKGVKGIVLNEEGKPVEGVAISSVTPAGNIYHMMTGPDGRFTLNNLKENVSLLFFNVEYKRLTLQPDFTNEMTVRMEKDPDYTRPATQAIVSVPRREVQVFPQGEPLIVIDGEITSKKPDEAMKELGYNFGIGKFIRGKEATDKYGERASNGVYEITTRKKALEMGLKPPFPRRGPDDYPTFQNNDRSTFVEWVLSQIKYPEEALRNKIEGNVSVNFIVELDGTISNVNITSASDSILNNEVKRVIKSSPRWEPPKNADVDEPLRTGFRLEFILPDQVRKVIEPFVVVEEMPMFPGGQSALLDYVQKNMQYPEEARKDNVQGRVIVRFAVNEEGNVEQISVLKGVNPYLDKEAVRLVSTLPKFKPGMQGGKPVPVWYMIPISFSLDQANQPATP